MELPIIEIKNVKKKYIIGSIGTGTMGNDVKTWWAKVRKKEDPNAPVLEEARRVGNEFMALNDVSFNIKKGERIGIIGGNGAGKSTLLKILSRVTAPTSGEVILRGRVTSMLEVGTGFNPEMTGRENIYLNGAILGMTKAEIDAKLEQIIDFSEVREFIDTPVKRYSSGMYVKLAFSVSAHLDSEILIMDEVLAVGDAAFQKKCLDKMQDTAAQQNRTILFVSHSMQNIKALCDRCVVLKEGKVIFDGITEEAINLYLPNYTEDVFLKRNFEETPKMSYEMKCRILSTEIVNKEFPVFDAGEILKVKFEVELLENIDNFVHRWIVYNKDLVIMTMFSKHANKNQKFIEFDTTILAPGTYRVDWYIGEYNAEKFCNYTQQVGAVSFVIEKNKNLNYINWNSDCWGSCTTDKFVVLEGEI